MEDGKTVYDFTVRDAAGKDFPLSQFKGRPLLIVNTASKCGFTPQYEGLQKLHDELKDQLVILGFPCNQFGAQEPGSDEEIQQFCSLNYGVKFPVLGKVDVNGDSADPLYVYLKEAAPGLLGTKAIKWNFTKFLIDRSGNPVKRFAPNDTPEKIRREVESVIG